MLAVHWYPEGRNECRRGENPCWSDRITNDWQPQTPSVIDARVQAPRSLWDPGFTEKSWVSENIPGCRARACPVQLLRLKASVAARYPDTGIAVTEYYFGRGGDISGGIAQADVLGVFGREGVTAAALWPAAQVYAWNDPDGSCDGPETCATLAYRCLFAAFKSFLDYDGKGGHFGDTSISAQTSHVAETSVYASVDSSSPGPHGDDRHQQDPRDEGRRPRLLERRTLLASGGVPRDGGGGSLRRSAGGARARACDSSGARVSLPPMSIGVYVFRP